MAVSDYKRYLVPGALVIGGLTAGSMLAPLGLAAAEESTTDTDSNETDSNETESTDSTDSDSTETDSSDDDGWGRGHRHGDDHDHEEGHGRGRLGRALHAASDVVAEALGMTTEDLRAARAEGKSLADIAADQGVAVEDLEAALVAAAEARIDEAVAEGRLSEDNAAELTENLADRIGEQITRAPGEGRLGDKVREFRGKMGDRGADVAEFLGMSAEDLRAAMADGQTLADVAEAQGVSEDDLVAFLLEKAQERLDQAVENGRIDADEVEERLAEAESRIEERLNAEPGELREGKGFGRRGGHHRGHHDDVEDSDSDI